MALFGRQYRLNPIVSCAVVAVAVSTGRAQPPSYGPDYRIWTSAAGDRKAEATLVALDSESVTLRRRDRESPVLVPLSVLSKADRAFLEDHRIHDFPHTLFGQVVAVPGGDALTISADKKRTYYIHFAGIDAPEFGQGYWQSSRSALRAALLGKVVRIQWKTRDRYQRILGHVYLGDQWINRSVVENGWAWHDHRYSADKSLAEAEQGARLRGRGLWANDAAPMTPWEYRRLPTTANSIDATSPGPIAMSGIRPKDERIVAPRAASIGGSVVRYRKIPVNLQVAPPRH